MVPVAWAISGIFIAMTIIVSYNDTMGLTAKHRRTLAAVFKDPVSANIPWRDIERLLKALGAELSEGRGSRVRIHLNGVRAVFHRPHPEKDADKGAVKSMRRFLVTAGVKPED